MYAPDTTAAAHCPQCSYAAEGQHRWTVAAALRGHLRDVHGRKLNGATTRRMAVSVCQCGSVATVYSRGAKWECQRCADLESKWDKLTNSERGLTTEQDYNPLHCLQMHSVAA